MKPKTDDWEVVVHELALPEVQALKKHDPCLFKRMIEDFKRMAAMSDPRRYCRTKALCGELSGWYRLAVYGSGNNSWRFLFRIIQESDRGVLIEIARDDNLVLDEGV